MTAPASRTTAPAAATTTARTTAPEPAAAACTTAPGRGNRPMTAAATHPLAAAPAVARGERATPSTRVAVFDTASRASRHPESAISPVECAGLWVAPSAFVHRDPTAAERRHVRRRGCAGARR